MSVYIYIYTVAIVVQNSNERRHGIFNFFGGRVVPGLRVRAALCPCRPSHRPSAEHRSSTGGRGCGQSSAEHRSSAEHQSYHARGDHLVFDDREVQRGQAN